MGSIPPWKKVSSPKKIPLVECWLSERNSCLDRHQELYLDIKFQLFQVYSSKISSFFSPSPTFFAKSPPFIPPPSRAAAAADLLYSSFVDPSKFRIEMFCFSNTDNQAEYKNFKKYPTSSCQQFKNSFGMNRFEIWNGNQIHYSIHTPTVARKAMKLGTGSLKNIWVLACSSCISSSSLCMYARSCIMFSFQFYFIHFLLFPSFDNQSICPPSYARIWVLRTNTKTVASRLVSYILCVFPPPIYLLDVYIYILLMYLLLFIHPL